MDEQKNEAMVRIQDDLYNAVNGDWQKTAVIPDDQPFAGGFADLNRDVEKTMMADFQAFANGEKSSDIPEIRYATMLYKKVLDTEKRNSDGIEPALPYLETIRAIQSVDDLNRDASKLLMQGVELPVQVGVSINMQNTLEYTLCNSRVVV